MFKLNLKPMVVEVFDDRYECYGDPTSSWHVYLYQYIKRTGGINHTVPPGRYHFTMKRSGFKIVSVLEPIKK